MSKEEDVRSKEFDAMELSVPGERKVIDGGNEDISVIDHWADNPYLSFIYSEFWASVSSFSIFFLAHFTSYFIEVIQSGAPLEHGTMPHFFYHRI